MKERNREFGRRIYEIRQSQGFTLRDMARRTHLSLPYLSRLERRDLPPPFKTVVRLAKALNVPTSALLREEIRADKEVLLRGKRFPLFRENNKVKIELLTQVLEGNPRMLVGTVTFQPSAEVIAPRHNGEEVILVTKGRLEVLLGDKGYILEEGDSINFESIMPHRYRNSIDMVSEFIICNSPPYLCIG